jgi:hypothetical protein
VSKADPNPINSSGEALHVALQQRSETHRKGLETKNAPPSLGKAFQDYVAVPKQKVTPTGFEPVLRE